ncbi:uncharacterized protein LOC133532083 [Cydia pomonella]|uniref:uncharacterized protein LOC133532083 n=1 Tax=Cydia pomonella TaxID=82600 RepID=UPI002ADDFEB9|nr:uncharacterized protein LOC133532083 [Cydia pomonella]
MRASGTLWLALLLAGINGSDIEPQLFEKGHFVEITVVTFPNTTSECYLVTPSNTNIDLMASETLSDKYEYLTNYISTCRVRINDLDENDEGLWSLHAGILSENGEVNELKEQLYVTIRESDASQETDVNSAETVISEENSQQSAEENATSEETSEDQNGASLENSEATSKESSEAISSEEENAVETQWLSDLQFRTRTGLDVDINLPRTMNSEKCQLTKPDGTTVDVGDEVAGVTAHTSTHYVSCRVVVGPMDASLLGKWTLCGSYEENNVEHRRCQNAEIIWRSTANPDSIWQTTINARFNHVVNFHGTLTPAVRGSGSVVSCHLVTPNDEDLVVTRDREYPDVNLAQDTDSTCSIAIGPLAERHLANWTVYGTFDSSLWGYNEVRQPISMELYDENHPYDQAYNVTTLNPTQHVVNLGSTIFLEVAGTGVVDVCQFTMPSGESYWSSESMPTGAYFVSLNRVACRLSIGPITANMIGDWRLIGKFSNRGVHTENRLSFTIIQEDPSNPIEEDRTVENLNEQFLDTSIGASHRVTIASDIFTTFQSCHIRAPEGLQYTIMEGFHIPGVEVVTASNINCGVTIEVSEDLIGTWTLISREIRSSLAIEKRLPFIIYVEESVDAVINEITITEGNSIHVRLANPTELYDTCSLKDPNDEEPALFSLDDNHKETCGFVVPSVDANHTGIWNIVYGKTIIYKAPVLVHVNARENHTLHLTLVEHASVDKTIGPQEAVYCKVTSPDGDVVFDGFGRCQVVLNRVFKDQHEGVWTMVVGMPGRIVTERHSLLVSVTAADAKPEVSSYVSVNKPTVELTCSVTSSQQVTGCLFRSPALEEVLVANPGVSEGRYVFHVNQTSIESDYYYSCSLQITEPVTSDLGLWRCDLESEEENYYGFLTVLCPWAMQDPIVAESVVAEPVLVAQANSLSIEEQEPASLACSARAPLRYCYFRAPNGTVFNVGPGMSSPTMQYVGAGLDAGECGVRFQSLLHSDAGGWSCHASINGQEQNQSIYVQVKEEMRVSSKIEYDGWLVIEGQVAWNRELEYCRFVRFDGFGFSSIVNLQSSYYLDESSSSRGICRIRVALTHENQQPWTVVAKLEGRDGEISRVVTFDWPEPELTPPRYYNALFMWLPILMIFIGCMMLGAAFAPSKNRSWVAERASSLRESMRRFPSFRKKPQIADKPSDTNPAA